MQRCRKHPLLETIGLPATLASLDPLVKVKSPVVNGPNPWKDRLESSERADLRSHVSALRSGGTMYLILVESSSAAAAQNAGFPSVAVKFTARWCMKRICYERVSIVTYACWAC